MNIQVIQQELDTPPLLLKLTQDLGKLPAGIVVQLPYDAAIRAINRRYGVQPAGDFNRTFADLCIETPLEMEQAALHMLISDHEVCVPGADD
jgi:hypothetical protein